jgi:type IV pilus assembly protein PilO
MALNLSDKNQRNKLLIGLVPLILLGLYWYMYYGKSQAEVTDLKTHLESIETKNNAAKKIAAKGGPELKKKLAVYEQHMVRLEQLIPKSEEVPELLHTMTLRAQETGVELSLMKPQKEEPGAFYTKQTYSIGVIGPYHDVGSFLAAVGSLSRIITPVNVTLKPRTDETRDGQKKLDATFKIQTYVVPKAPPPPPPAAPGAPGAAGAPAAAPAGGKTNA